MMNKIKETVSLQQEKGIFFLLDSNGKKLRYKPWLGDIFSFMYDRIMEKSVFPGKFNGSMETHYTILRDALQDCRNKNILELACGSGDAIKFLHHENTYTGVDISRGLLCIANKRFNQHGFLNSELYLADACNLPFQDNFFELGICNLSLNFFKDIDLFISELNRVLQPGAAFYCSVPIPEKKNPGSKIHGSLYSEKTLREKFQNQSFDFEVLPSGNGALIYFKAQKSPGA